MVYTLNESERKDNLFRYRDIKHHDFIKRCEDLTSFEGKYDDEIPQDCYVIVCHNEAALNMWDGALYNYHHVSVISRHGGKEQTLYGGEADLCQVTEGNQNDHQKNGKSNSDLAASTPDSPCPKYQYHFCEASTPEYEPCSICVMRNYTSD